MVRIPDDSADRFPAVVTPQYVDLFLDLWVLAFPSRQGYGLSVLMLDNKTFMAMIALEQINALCLLRFRTEGPGHPCRHACV